jgi:hypothetical protein
MYFIGYVKRYKPEWRSLVIALEEDIHEPTYRYITEMKKNTNSSSRVPISLARQEFYLKVNSRSRFYEHSHFKGDEIPEDYIRAFEPWRLEGKKIKAFVSIKKYNYKGQEGYSFCIKNCYLAL